MQLSLPHAMGIASMITISMDNFDETLEALVAKFEQVDGDFAQYAVENKWVDALKTREDVRQELVELVGEDDNPMGVNITSFDTYLSVINAPVPSNAAPYPLPLVSILLPN